jgi:hypothetical protein
MSNNLMSGLWKFMFMVPPFLWKKQIDKTRKRIREELKFMSYEHRLVHHFVVRELPRNGAPMTLETISKGLDLDRSQVKSIVSDLEEHMTFLVTNADGSVIWAYPVTVEQTPHRVIFSTGENLYAA